MARRTPPKRRHRERPAGDGQRSTRQQTAVDDPNAYSAPGHLAGQFEAHDYGHGHGGYGFTQHLLP